METVLADVQLRLVSCTQFLKATKTLPGDSCKHRRAQPCGVFKPVYSLALWTDDGHNVTTTGQRDDIELDIPERQAVIQVQSMSW